MTPEEMFEAGLLGLDLCDEQRQMLRDVAATFYRINESFGVSAPPALPPLPPLDPELGDGTALCRTVEHLEQRQASS